MPRRFPKRIGSWVVTWKLGDQVLASQRVCAISQRHFQRSLRVVDTRFVIQSDKQEVSVSRQLPPLEQVARVGPCFLVCSREAGMAGLCRLRVRTQVPGAVQPPLLMDEEILITDGPTMVAPGTVEAAELTQVKAFEICLSAGPRSGDSAAALGILPLCPAPVAAFTSEGGFKAPEEYPWSAAAEEQLNEQWRVFWKIAARVARTDMEETLRRAAEDIYHPSLTLRASVTLARSVSEGWYH